MLAFISVWWHYAQRPEPSREACAGDCWTLHIIGDEGNGADGVHLGDIDRDGYLDVVAGWEQSGHLMLYLNPLSSSPAPARWPAVEISAGLDMRGVEDAAFADLDGTGSPGGVLSSAEGRAQQLAIHQAHGPLLDATSWQATELVPTRPEMYMKARASSRGRGSPSIVAGSREGGDNEPALFLFRRDTDGWLRERIAAVDFKTTGLKLVDIDGDGWRDVLFAGRSEIAWLRNPGAPGKDWRRQTIARGVSEFAVCDLDGDGRLGVVAGTSRHSDLVARWFRISADGNTPWESWPITTANGRPGGDKFVIKGVACGDLDNDGDVELVFTASGAGHGVFSLKRTGNPASNAHWSLHYHVGHMDSMKYDNIELADLDRDGDLDIVTSEEGEGVISPGLGVMWLENPTSGNLLLEARLSNRYLESD